MSYLLIYPIGIDRAMILPLLVSLLGGIAYSLMLSHSALYICLIQMVYMKSQTHAKIESWLPPYFRMPTLMTTPSNEMSQILYRALLVMKLGFRFSRNFDRCCYLGWIRHGDAIENALAESRFSFLLTS